MTRRNYIMDFAVLLATGSDDVTRTDAEYAEAVSFLDSIGVRIPEMEMAANA